MPGGEIFGAIFFFCLFVAGISSSISMVETFSAAIIDKFGFNRKAVVSTICIMGFIGSTVFTTQAGLFWLDILDHFITHYGLVVVGIFECILVGWLFQLDIMRKHINRISSIKLGPWWNGLIRYFIPLTLGIILAGDIYVELSKPYGGYSWVSIIMIGRDWVTLTLIAGLWISSRPWKTDNHNTPGRSDY